MNILIYIIGFLLIACSIQDGRAANDTSATQDPKTTIINVTTVSPSTTEGNTTASSPPTTLNITLTPISNTTSNSSHVETSSTSQSTTSTTPTMSTTLPSTSSSTPTKSTSSTPRSTPATTAVKTTTPAHSSETSSIATTTNTSTVMNTSTTATPSTTVPNTNTSSVTTVTPKVSPSSSSKHNIIIAETNILLVKPNQLNTVFVELSGPVGDSLNGLVLVVRNASEKDAQLGIISLIKLTGSLNAEGLYVVDTSLLDLKKLNADMDSVVVALYSNDSHARMLATESLIDSLFLFSVEDASEVTEVYHPQDGNKIFVKGSLLNLSQAASISYCSGKTSGFVLTKATRNENNNCDLKEAKSYQMKLTLQLGKNKCDATRPMNQFSDLLSKQIVTKVNEKRQCGLTLYNMNDLISQSQCVKDSEVIAVKFNVRTIFNKQIECITDGYKSFTKDRTSVTVQGRDYMVANCSQQCFSNVLPHSGDDGNNMKLTVAVVISCIGVFLVILLVVIIYMRRKRRGILQFRMTRLDEDDDDLVGDMDDFVGNQGATFSNFRS